MTADQTFVDHRNTAELPNSAYDDLTVWVPRNLVFNCLMTKGRLPLLTVIALFCANAETYRPKLIFCQTQAVIRLLCQLRRLIQPHPMPVFDCTGAASRFCNRRFGDRATAVADFQANTVVPEQLQPDMNVRLTIAFLQRVLQQVVDDAVECVDRDAADIAHFAYLEIDLQIGKAPL